MSYNIHINNNAVHPVGAPDTIPYKEEPQPVIPQSVVAPTVIVQPKKVKKQSKKKKILICCLITTVTVAILIIIAVVVILAVLRNQLINYLIIFNKSKFY